LGRDQTNTECVVHFRPGNAVVAVKKGTSLLEAAIQAGSILVAACGGSGTCGTCKVRIEEGEVEFTRTARLSDAELKEGIRQACQSKVLTDLRVYVPPQSRPGTAIAERMGRVSGRGEGLVTGWRFEPPLQKYFLELPAPSIHDNISDLSRLLRGLKTQFGIEDPAVDFEIVKGLPVIVREQEWRVTVTAMVTAVEDKTATNCRLKLVNVEPGDTTLAHYSLAIDVGTTTVKGQLLDLNEGKAISEYAEVNGQTIYGADVITRIALCQKPGGLKRLQGAVVGTINSIIDKMLTAGKVERDHISHVSLSGNTTMTHIFLGIDPRYIRLAPYTPAATYPPPVKCVSLGLNLPDHVWVSAFPMVASYIGGDIVAGVVAAAMHQTSKLTYYIDIGTNGQIVIGNRDWMVTAACSAGPAFEGGEIKHGMIATAGAIEGCDIDPASFEPAIEVIGDEKPRGICGSGLINAVAELLENGVINRDGHFNTGISSSRVRHRDDGYEYVLVFAADTQIGKDIVLTEIDIDNLMRAKAAMYAGFQTLIKSVGLGPESVEQVIIAGAFGNYINVERAITIGLLPDLPRDRFIFIGNGSLTGARLADFSVDIIDAVRQVAKSMTNFELSENSDFMNNYVAALFLPHTNCSEFASVCERLPGANATKEGAG
jgi:uncharacterized 2Fe-2S/4Fe-4S cluster protein (DUF4445 family)